MLKLQSEEYEENKKRIPGLQNVLQTSWNLRKKTDQLIFNADFLIASLEVWC